MEPHSRIYVAGHNGLAGSALVRRLQRAGYRNLILRRRQELDLTDQVAVRSFFTAERPDYVFLAAARVGGIWANINFPADFIRDNLLIQTNASDAAHRVGVNKLLFLASSAIYPKDAPQPLCEMALLTGPLDPATEPYAVAKIAGIRMCQAYRRQFGFRAITVIPPNLYGIGDNFDLQTSHVLPALIRKFHDAKVTRAPQVVIWGTGAATREFLFADDLADACLFLMDHYDEEEVINVGVGEEITIRDLAALIVRIVGYTGEIVYDSSKPEGVARRLQDISRVTALGWRASVPLSEGIRRTYEWYLEHVREAVRDV